MLHQSEMYDANEYLEQIVADFTEALGLDYDEKDVEIAATSMRACGLENLLVLKREGFFVRSV